MRFPRSLTRFLLLFRKETPYTSTFTSKLQTGLCVSHSSVAVSLSVMPPSFSSCAESRRSHRPPSRFVTAGQRAKQ